MLLYESLPREDIDRYLNYIKRLSKSKSCFSDNSSSCFGEYAFCYRTGYKPDNIFVVAMFFNSYIKEYINKYNETYENTKLNIFYSEEGFIEIKITDTSYNVPYFNYATEENLEGCVKEHRKTSFGRRTIDVLEKLEDVMFASIQIELNPEYNEQAKYVLYLLNCCAIRAFSLDYQKILTKEPNALDSLISSSNKNNTSDGFFDGYLRDHSILDRMNDVELMNEKFNTTLINYHKPKYSRCFQYLQKIFQTDLINYILK